MKHLNNKMRVYKRVPEHRAERIDKVSKLNKWRWTMKYRDHVQY